MQIREKTINEIKLINSALIIQRTVVLQLKKYAFKKRALGLILGLIHWQPKRQNYQPVNSNHLNRCKCV